MLANDLPNELSTQRLWQIWWMKAYNYDNLNEWKLCSGPGIVHFSTTYWHTFHPFFIHFLPLFLIYHSIFHSFVAAAHCTAATSIWCFKWLIVTIFLYLWWIKRLLCIILLMMVYGVICHVQDAHSQLLQP